MAYNWQENRNCHIASNVLPMCELANASWAKPQAAHAALRTTRC